MEHIVNGDIGGRLRRAREQRGLSLHDAARLTKLSTSVLQAIERNDFESLPHGVYRKAYLRTLAGEVGLNPNEIAGEYDNQFAPAIAPPVADRNTVLHEEWVRQLTPPPRRSLVTLVSVVAAVAWFAWPRPVEPTVTTPGRHIEIRTPLENSAPVSGGRIRGTAEPIATRRQADAPLRIEMAATGWCWVAAETDGQRVLYRLVEPGERLVLEAHRLISLRLGDAGAVTLSINGGPRRSPGRDGAVAVVEVTPDNVDGLGGAEVEAVSD